MHHYNQSFNKFANNNTVYSFPNQTGRGAIELAITNKGVLDTTDASLTV